MNTEKLKNVEYGNDVLKIVIPTSSPQATHELLMHGIATGLKQNIISPLRSQQDEAGLMVLASFLQGILPTEQMLTKN